MIRVVVGWWEGASLEGGVDEEGGECKDSEECELGCGHFVCLAGVMKVSSGC